VSVRLAGPRRIGKAGQTLGREALAPLAHRKRRGVLVARAAIHALAAAKPEDQPRAKGEPLLGGRTAYPTFQLSTLLGLQSDRGRLHADAIHVLPINATRY